jgi:predicted DNA-binding ribbon-helix-helix protein
LHKERELGNYVACTLSGFSNSKDSFIVCSIDRSGMIEEAFAAQLFNSSQHEKLTLCALIKEIVKEMSTLLSIIRLVYLRR